MYFLSNNDKAIKLVDMYKNVIYSYLEAIPDTGDKHFNHITTIPTSERTNENGHANFKFGYNQFLTDNQNYYETCNVRIETGAFGDIFRIKAVKATSIKYADLIVFATECNPNVLYIADRNLNDNNAWLEDRTLRTVRIENYEGKDVTYYEYDISVLWSLGHIVKIYFDNAMLLENKINIIHNDYLTKSGKSICTEKVYHDYNLDLSHIQFVQYDARDAYIYFFGYKGYKYTNIALTIPMMVDQWKDYTDISEHALYQKLSKVLKKNIESDEVHSCKIKLNRTDDINPEWLNDKNEIEIYVTTSPDYCIEDHKVEKSTSDMKSYNKVVKYLKRHNNVYNPKWTEEEKAIADKYLTK